MKEARIATKEQLEAVRSRLSRLEEMERSKEASLSHYASLVPQGLAGLTGAERSRVYKTLRLRVLALLLPQPCSQGRWQRVGLGRQRLR